MASLIHLFNVEHVDFVRKNGDDYDPVEWPKFATHSLRPTRWNTDKEHKPNSRGKLVKPDGYALSVCAEPMKIRFHRTTLKVKRRFPDGKTAAAPVYKKAAPVESKRSVLAFLVDYMGAPAKFRRLLRRFNDADCDKLYNNLIRASRIKFN